MASLGVMMTSHTNFRKGPLLLEQNDEYAIQKRYMSLESLAPMSDNPPLSLPAIPAMA